jgi:hypothetical protein
MQLVKAWCSYLHIAQIVIYFNRGCTAVVQSYNSIEMMKSIKKSLQNEFNMN